MQPLRSLCLSVGSVAALLGCSGAGGTTDTITPAQEAMVGAYSANLSGSDQGLNLTGTIRFTMNQTGQNMSGSYSWDGHLSGTFVAGTGGFTGTITSGINPTVNLTLTVAGCSNIYMQYTGTYDSTTHKLTVTGPFFRLGANCLASQTFQLTLVLSA